MINRSKQDNSWLALIESDPARRLHLFETALEAASNSIVITDAEARILWVNLAFTELTGYTRAEVIGRTPGELLKSGRQESTFYEELWHTILAGQVWRGELINRHKDGSLYSEVQTISPVPDEAGEITHFIAIKQDVTEYRDMQARLQREAWYDALTGLPNRHLLTDRLAQALTAARRHGLWVGVFLVDLDRIKMVNDTFGHSVGDEVLKAVAERLRDYVRDSDTVARVGGDKFAVLLGEIAQEADGALVADKILTLFMRPLEVQLPGDPGQSREFSFTVSIGVSLYPNDAADAATLLQNADTAMYLAKEKGRSRYEFFTHELKHRAEQRIELYNALHGAIDRQEFVLLYQPLLTLGTQRVAGCEALLRWERPGHGRVSPDAFIPMLEETRMIVTLGRWILNEACGQFRSLRAAGLTLPRVAVNVSVHQLADGDFPDVVAQVLVDNALTAGDLELEITEGSLMSTAEGHSETLTALHRMGVRLSIDDFGTGYSSLSYLKRLPVNALKIDRSFVRDIASDPQDAAIVRTILSMAGVLELEIVAEGIETEDQLTFLRTQGCDLGQGYLFSPPLNAEALAEFLRAQEG